MNEKQVRQQRLMRKTAFIAGFMRYISENEDQLVDCDERLQKLAFSPLALLNTPALLAIAPAVAAYFAGNGLGRIGGGMYGRATGVSPDSVREREYDLAGATTDRMVEEMQADEHNRQIREALKPGGATNPSLSWR